jgi:hypothetical protein
VPGGLAGAIAIGIPPTLLLGVSLAASFSDPDAGSAGWMLAAGLIALGPILYAMAAARPGVPASG